MTTNAKDRLIEQAELLEQLAQNLRAIAALNRTREHDMLRRSINQQVKTDIRRVLALWGMA